MAAGPRGRGGAEHIGSGPGAWPGRQSRAEPPDAPATRHGNADFTRIAFFCLVGPRQSDRAANSVYRPPHSGGQAVGSEFSSPRQSATCGHFRLPVSRRGVSPAGESALLALLLLGAVPEQETLICLDVPVTSKPRAMTYVGSRKNSSLPLGGRPGLTLTRPRPGSRCRRRTAHEPPTRFYCIAINLAGITIRVAVPSGA